MTDPTDEELLSLYCLAEGYAGSYDGWMAIYKAGAKAERDRVVDLYDHKHDSLSPVHCQKCDEWEELTGPCKA